jgi:hypothetical protein
MTRLREPGWRSFLFSLKTVIEHLFPKCSTSG